MEHNFNSIFEDFVRTRIKLEDTPLPVQMRYSQILNAEQLIELELTIGRILLMQERFDEAFLYLKSASAGVSAQAAKQNAASLFIQLSREFEKNPDNIILAQEALELSLKLLPGATHTALAQFWKRQKNLSEAIYHWRKAIELNPRESNYYLNLADLYAQTSQPLQALNCLLKLVEEIPSNTNYLFAAQRIDKLASRLPEANPSATVKIALLSNSTPDHLQSYLKVECFRADLRPIFYQGGFDQYSQEIFNLQSGLYNFKPDVLVFAVHSSRLFPNLYDFDPSKAESLPISSQIDQGLETVKGLLDAFTARCNAVVLFHNMVLPQYPALGIFDWQAENSQFAAFNEINRRLALLVRDLYKNVYILDEEKVQARIGKGNATDTRLWLTARIGWSHSSLLELAKEYIRFLKPLKALNRKCIILDLDHTLWGGVVGEDGLEGIQIGADPPGNAFAAFQRELLKLWKRGVLLAICSKNNQEEALAVFQHNPGMVLKLSHFAAIRINWEQKEVNIVEISKELNIGLDSLVFLDDNPVERARVKAALPQVLVPDLSTDPANYRQNLLDLNVFENLFLTAEDFNRNTMYAAQQARQQFENQFQAASLEEYLSKLNMVVQIETGNNQNLARIAQLTVKTNQFNLTTRRYTEAHIKEMQIDGAFVFGLRVADRFGDNGLTGAAIFKPKSESYCGDRAEIWEIDTFLLSCRVMGRGVETALLFYISNLARQSGARFLEGWFIPTSKNAPARDLYSRHGFNLIEQTPEGSELWRTDLKEKNIIVPGWLEIKPFSIPNLSSNL